MLDKIDFNVTDTQKCVMFIEQIKKDELSDLMKSVVPSIINDITLSLKTIDSGIIFKSLGVNFTKNSKSLIFLIGSNLFELKIIKDNIAFQITNVVTKNISHEYDVFDLIDFIPTHNLKNLFKSKTNTDYVKSMSKILHLININRFIIKK